MPVTVYKWSLYRERRKKFHCGYFCKNFRCYRQFCRRIKIWKGNSCLVYESSDDSAAVRFLVNDSLEKLFAEHEPAPAIVLPRY
ncbi:hypothetical protein SAMN05216299_102188 [Nitrosospira sp. Nsp14]|nr:hypothetical protein SAMN05216299_102188 [Nitrosospira sp. Nsp14]